MNGHSVFGPRLKQFEHAKGDEKCKHKEFGLTNIKSKHINGKFRPSLKKRSISDKTKFEAKVIEQMVSTIEELKNKVHYFENYITYEVAPEVKNVTIPSKVEDQYVMGDTNESKNLNPSDHMKNTEKFAQDSKKKSETDASIVKSSISLMKNTYININPAVNPKYLKSAAQDFIKHAEELKSNITYMLDNENCDTITLSDESEIAADPYSKEKYMFNNQSNLQCLLLSVSGQYDAILKTLGSIEQRVQQSDKLQIHKSVKLSQTSAKVSTYIPNSVHKVENIKTSKTKTLDNSITKESPSKATKKKWEKKLDPIVLVYEPIKPADYTQNICALCGYGSSTCLIENCRERVIKSSLDKEDVSCGFMVTYTPNLRSQSECISDLVKKDSKKLKKKKSSCLWF
ncbi:hypothetical protein PPYR_06436 [Photinus pyralis]|uniref:Uncharacterized protein n=2 Tax=Photinus pyralis TaxID=7054 RepID=A0A5N4ATP1_PHOPY|nr:uncharacterized protein LOC116167314 [Photinus pyralis]KAB0800697.1 hypothetical protein PPYR_06436 [Photinus pyralis]